MVSKGSFDPMNATPTTIEELRKQTKAEFEQKNPHPEPPKPPTERLTIIEADALRWTAQNKQRFDCAWHDLWTNRDNGEPHLDVWHARLFVNCRRTVKRQGAWAFDRSARTLMVRHGFPWLG
jgi:spermidine synthase